MNWGDIRKRILGIVAAAEQKGAKIVNTPLPQGEPPLAVILHAHAEGQRFERIKLLLDEPQVAPRADVVGPPASAREVATAEKQLGAAFPASVREALTKLSSHVNVAWTCSDWSKSEMRRVPFSLGSGELVFSTAGLVRMQKEKDRFVAQVFPDERKKEARPWHGVFAVIAVGNGDYLAVDQKKAQADGPVVYLSHDGAAEHGAILGSSFGDFLDRWTRLACVGPESWALKPFLKRTGLDPEGPNAVKWRSWLGLKV
jgi:hypothetical protein